MADFRKLLARRFATPLPGLNRDQTTGRLLTPGGAKVNPPVGDVQLIGGQMQQYTGNPQKDWIDAPAQQSQSPGAGAAGTPSWADPSLTTQYTNQAGVQTPNYQAPLDQQLKRANGTRYRGS